MENTEDRRKNTSDIIETILRTNIYIQPVHFVLAILTNLLNIRLLSSHALRSSPCTYYFLGYAVCSIIYTCLLCPFQFLRGFSIDISHGGVTCKIHAYLLFVIPLEANLMLIFASFDRYSSSLYLRRLYSTSSRRTARRNIIVGVILCTLYMLPMLFIYHWNAKSRKCSPSFHTSVQLYIFSQVLIYYTLSPLLMVILGIRTISNIHRQSMRAMPIYHLTKRRRTEYQLARMLILQVAVHLILVLPFGILYGINSFLPSTLTAKIIATRLAFVSWQQCDYFLSFFLYILSASVYRQELSRILRLRR